MRFQKKAQHRDETSGAEPGRRYGELGSGTAASDAQRRESIGSSTEGHVSHVLSSRMSSRPKTGWSRTGSRENGTAKSVLL